MHERYRTPCVIAAGRATNDQLCAWLRDDVDEGGGSFEQLVDAVSPLLYGFFEGQMHVRLQASVDVLVKATLVAVHHGRASYNPGRPFRAWLLELARYQVLTLGAVRAEAGEASAAMSGHPPEASVTRRPTMAVRRSQRSTGAPW